jgi:hypothetical protein
MIRRLSLALAVALPVTGLAAQSPTAHLGLGIQAYRSVDMVVAVQELRLALGASGADGLNDDARKQALTYLGAAELYGDRRDSAVTAFRRLVYLDPRHRPDPVVFPPDVVGLFDEVRRSTLAVAVSAPARASFGARDPGLPVSLYPSARHVVVVTAETVVGEVLDTIHNGPVADSLIVRWTGRGRGRTPATGGLVLGVTSVDGRGRAVRRVELPLQVVRGPSERLDAPPPPVLLPERQPWGKPIGRLTVGLGLAAVSMLVLPEVTNSNGAGVVTGLVFSAGAIIGFAEARPGKPLPENVAANAITLARWRAQADAVERSNRTRSDGAAVIVEVGEPVVRRGALH